MEMSGSQVGKQKGSASSPDPFLFGFASFRAGTMDAVRGEINEPRETLQQIIRDRVPSVQVLEYSNRRVTESAPRLW
jgi:hypothetical protein